ncbi:MAG: hypothetical protein RLZ98_775 [Pseudomonadota bacterium]|jgi:peptide/nickel transport system substrate-binding protein
MIKQIRIALAVAIVAVIAVGGFGPELLAAERPNLMVAVNKLPRSLEPVEKTGNVDVRVHYSVFDTLIRRNFTDPKDGGASLMPGLAESWKRIDPTTLELKLRRGVKFHNGDAFDADDVLFTFSAERMLGKEALLRDGRRYFSHVKAVEKVDDHTVRFVTKKPDLLLEQRLATYASWIVSKKQWMSHKKAGEEWAGKQPKTEEGSKAGPMTWLNYALKEVRWNPVGTGPLKFKSWKNNDHVTFVSNDEYFLGKPNFKSVVFKEVPELAARIAGLVAGDFQMIVDVTPDQFKLLEGYKDIDVRSVVLENSSVLVLSPTAEKLKDKRLRQAMSLAIDRDALRNALWQGKNYTPNGHQLPSFGPMYNPKRPGYVYDQAKAQELVKASGYDGSEISFRLIPNYYLNGVEAAQIVQEMWRQVGIKARLDMVDNFTQVRAKGVEVFLWSNTYRLPDPTGAIDVLYGERSAFQRKYKLWEAPKTFNEGLAKILNSSEMKARYETYQQVLDIFEDEMPITILYNALYSYAVKKNIEWTPYPIFYMDFRPDVLKIKG